MASCGCNKHQILNGDNEGNVYKFSHKKYPKIVQSTLIKLGLITIYTSALCTKCADYCMANLIDESPAVKKIKGDNNKSDTVCDRIIILLQNNLLSKEELLKLSHALGASINNSILEDAQNISQEYRTNGDISISKWVCKRQPILLSFVKGATGVYPGTSSNISTGKTSSTEQKRLACLASAIDSIYKCRFQPLVCPIPFRMNLLSYFISGSRFTTSINNSHAPAGSYTCLKNWLKEQCTSRVDVETHDDVITYFDNNQVIARNWRVNYNYKCKASVVTTLAHIKPNVATTFQANELLSPARWLYGLSSTVYVTDLLDTFLKKCNEDFGKIRHVYIKTKLNEMTAHNATNDHQTHDPYSFVPNGHDGSPTIQTGEPVFCNPCSYESVKKVFNHILEETGVGSKKKWTVIGCDGLPFVLGSRLIEKNETLQNIMLLPGHGHYEINIVKGLFKLLWNVCLQDIAKMLEYKSIRALTTCEKCADHHKAWMILDIFKRGCINEILENFISHCQNIHIDPSVNNFYKYVSDSKNPNFRFIFDVVFNYLIALEIYRAGIRRNNNKYILAGRCKLSELFYGLNQTMYQEIDYRDIKRRVLCPVELKDSGNCTESFTVSGHFSKGEGGDFILENINRKTKKWLPNGFPSEQDWLQVCKNLDKLEKMRENLESELQLDDNTHENIYCRNIEKEVTGWREMLRDSKYLQDINDISIHKSVTGNLLDNELKYFETKYQNNRKEYFNAIKDGSILGKKIQLEPIFVTPESRSLYHDISKKTKAQLSGIIVALLTDLRQYDTDHESDHLYEKWNKKIKGSTKDEMITFYKDISIAMESATGRNEKSDDDDDDERDAGNDNDDEM